MKSSPKLINSLFLLVMLGLALLLWAQDSNTGGRASRWRDYQMVAHTTKAVDYKQGSNSKVDLRGTSLMPDANGEAEVKATAAFGNRGQDRSFAARE